MRRSIIFVFGAVVCIGGCTLAPNISRASTPRIQSLDTAGEAMQLTPSARPAITSARKE